jgi:allantoate deiminase
VTAPASELGRRVVERCRALAEVSDEAGRLTRPYASPAMARANALVGEWMREAGLEVTVDAAGNLVGHRAGADPTAGTLLLGSHLDTVRDAGAFDGPLGVLSAIAALEVLDAELPFAVDVLGFADEEGLRFGTAYLGSRAIAGTFPDELLELRDETGMTLASALRAFGGDPDAIGAASRAGEKLVGYLEVHMEQGRELERAGVPVGVVSAIAGATRAAVRFTGRAGHAGTVPMEDRRDALCAAAEWVLAVEEAGRTGPGLLATVGRLETEPGAPNVVPGAAVAALDVRHPEDPPRKAAVAALRRRAEELATARGIEVGWETRLDTPAVAVDPALAGVLERAIAGRGLPVVRLPSGAGHDAVALADVVGVAMLFVRSRGGVSHHPDERVSEADAGVAVQVLADAVSALAREC